MAARFASSRCERAAALVMRTIRRQVYAQDRRLALLQLRQGKCRCAATVRTSAGCPGRGCASPIRRTFRPVVARISLKPFFGLFEFPAIALHHFLFCVATKIAWSLQHDFDPQGDGLAARRAPPFHVHAIVTKPSDSRHFFALIFWL